MAHVVVARSEPRLEVARVLREGVRALRGQLLGRVVLRLADGVRDAERVAVHEALLETEVDALVVRPAVVGSPFDEAEVRIRQGAQRVVAGRIRQRLIQVDQRRQVRAARVDEIRRQHHAERELTLESCTRLHDARRRIVGVDGAKANGLQLSGRGIEIRRVQESGGEALTQEEHGRARRLRDGLVDEAREIQRELILAADAIEQVVEDPPAAAQRRLLVELVDDAEARREVVAIRVDERAVFERSVLRKHQRAAAGRDEVGLRVARLERGRHVVVAEPEIHRQPRTDLPVVLNVEHRRLMPLLDDPHVRQLQVGDVAEQVVGHRVAGERRAEADRSAGRRNVHELVLHRRHDVDAGLERMVDAQPGHAVDELELVRVLELRQEVRRSDPAQTRSAEVPVDGDAGEAAGDERVGHRAGNRRRRGRRLTERLVNGVRRRARPGDAELVHHRRRENPRPTADERVGLDRLIAERGRAGAVEHAAECAGNLARAVRVDVAGEHAVGRARLPVAAREHAVRVVDEIGGAEEVVRARLIGQRHQRENRGRGRIDARLRDRVVRKRQTGQRVADRRSEHAGAIVGGGHTREARHAAIDARPFHVREEEGLAFDDRSAEVAAVLVLLVRRLRGVRTLREVVDRIHRVVAEILVGGSLEVVRARLGRDADCRARGASVFRRVRARHDLELLDRVDRRPRHLRRQLLHVLRDAVVVDAVEQKVVLEGARAVDVDAAGAAERRAAALLRVAIALHAGHQRQQVVPVADREGQVRYLRLRDDRAERRVVGIQELRALDDGDRLGEIADRQLHVEPRALADFERDDLRALLETAQLDLELIASRNEVDDLISARLARLLARCLVRAEIGDDDGGARQHAAIGIFHDTAQRRAIDLRRGGGEHQQEHGQRRPTAVKYAFHEFPL